MNFRIATSFSDSLARLTNDEQKAVKTTAFDLQMNPANPGMSFHKLDRARDKNFWSVRVGRDIRMIVHRAAESLMMCYVDHHDKAYRWAERRKLETHPKTGAAQIVEIRETVREIKTDATPEPASDPPATKPLLFAGMSDDELLEYGVPTDWLDEVRLADEDSLLELADHLPGEAAEALLEIATGGRPAKPASASDAADPFEHPDAQRRFRGLADADELALALEFPWEKWTIFLHPSQRQIVEKQYKGPARVSGSAGTGKTIVALHRAVHMARSQPDARVLLTTFSDTLARALEIKLHRLIGPEPRLGERLEVHAVQTLAAKLYKSHIGPVKIASREQVQQFLDQASADAVDHRFSARFLLSEWEDVVDAWQVHSWEEYRDVKRLGRKTRLPEQQRALLWSIFQQVRQDLKKQGLLTSNQMLSELAIRLGQRQQPLFDAVIVDEAQDISVTQLRFLATLVGDATQGLFFAGDLGQRIFQTPFSWKSLGVDIRGRSQTLRINYRTSHQIRRQADWLLGKEVSDVDGNTEDRRGTVSVFNGPAPEIRVFQTQEEEAKAVAQWISDRKAEGITLGEIGVFVRTATELPRAQQAAEFAGVDYQLLDETSEPISGKLPICTMHLAKGLEFRTAVVMACDDEVLPLQSRIEAVSDESDLEEVYDTERHLLYVACTRARDQLLITATDPASEFLDDFVGK